MRRNLYIAAFVAVLLIACVGGFIGGRVLLSRLQGDFAPRGGSTPPPSLPTEVAQAPATAAPTQPSIQPTQGPRPTATVLVVPAPVTEQPAVLTPEPTWTAGVEMPTLEVVSPGQTPAGEGQTPGAEGQTTYAPSATPFPTYPFVLAHAVRYSNNDCPGTYALGTVTDRNGNPLPGIRLTLVDEYGNKESAVTKPGAGDTGRYDFPMGGPPRRFFMHIVDEAGRPLSQEVEILHNLPPQEGKSCRWIDWRRS
jgi:hypothetical protein